MKRYATVEDFIAGQTAWSKELSRLREVLLSTGLEETVKWGAPCYTLNGKNVVGIGAFKSYFGLWFFQGALLDDQAGVLINAQAGKTKAMRQWRMQSAKEIKARTIKPYVKEAIEKLESGQEIKPERAKPIRIPEELESALAKDARARTAFEQLTRGRRREYAEYIADAKREATKQRRLEKILPMIAAGKGLNDRYR